MSKEYKSVMQLALSDIADELYQYSNKGGGRGIEVWDVRPSHIATKLTTKLNRELGLHKINKSNKNTLSA